MSKNEFICDCTVVHGDIVEEVGGRMCSADEAARLASFFKVFADPTRIKILWALDKHELCVCDIANLLSMTKSAVSHQLATLRRMSLVTCRREGKTIYYSPADDHIRTILGSGTEHIHE